MAAFLFVMALFMGTPGVPDSVQDESRSFTSIIR
jgi:hypothetical protein